MTPRKMKNKRKSVAMDKEYQLKRQRNNDAVRKSREKVRNLMSPKIKKIYLLSYFTKRQVDK